MPAVGQGLKVDIVGLKDTNRALKGTDLAGVVKQVNREAGDIVGRAVASGASAGTEQQQALADTVRAASATSGAKIMIGTAAKPWAVPAFMGARERTGWYAAPKYGESKGRQAPAWVGNGWDVGDSLDGRAPGEPYILGDAVRATKDRVIDLYDRELSAALGAVFPD